jgi:haloacetate dehalogenase
VRELFPGFTTLDRSLPGGGSVHARAGGEGPAVLLLHGWPQTHAMWHPIAPALAREHTVVLPDLRGYGRSTAPEGDLTFRAMAADVHALMTGLGHERYHVVGHDRGARVTHRLAFDQPGAVRSVALLDILPTLDVWRLMDDWLMRRYFHWGFLVQPGGLPEHLIDQDPDYFLHRVLTTLAGTPGLFDPDAMADYERAARRPEVVAAWCGDYRAAAGPDLEHDRADAGRTLDVPALVLWGERGVVGAREDPLAVWRRHFPRAAGGPLPAGHFLAEERPDQVLAALRTHLTL